MSAVEVAVRLVEALAWPAVAGFAVILLRGPLSTLLSRDSPIAIKLGPFEVAWDRAAAKIEKSAGAELPPTPTTATATAPDAPSRITDELAPAIRDTPLLAIQEAYRLLEEELRTAVGPAEGADVFKMGPIRLARLGAERERIGADVLEAVDGLMVMHNMAAHEKGPAVTSERAGQYVSLVDATIQAIRSGSGRRTDGAASG